MRRHGEGAIITTIDSGNRGDGVVRRTKRLWTDEVTRSICFKTTAPGVSGDHVARRYAWNANLIAKWRRNARFAPDAAVAAAPAEEQPFVRLEIIMEARGPVAAPTGDDHIEIKLARGLRRLSTARRSDMKVMSVVTIGDPHLLVDLSSQNSPSLVFWRVVREVFLSVAIHGAGRFICPIDRKPQRGLAGFDPRVVTSG